MIILGFIVERRERESEHNAEPPQVTPLTGHTLLKLQRNTEDHLKVMHICFISGCFTSLRLKHRCGEANNHIRSSPSASSKSHLSGGKKERENVRRGAGGGGGVREKREREKERRCNYQERSLRDQLHFKAAGPRVPCSTQPRVPVLWE